MIIDAYAHCGISKYFPVEVVLATMEEAGVDRTVLCQHLGEYDNGYLAEVVAQHSGRFAAACLVDPNQPEAISQLRQWHATRSFRGLRVLAEWLPRNPGLCLEAVDLGMTLVIYAPDGIASAIPDILKLVHQRPGARIVVSHLGNPKVDNSRLVGGSEILTLASDPGIHVQLSGLSMFCEYPYTPLKELIIGVIEQFGPERVMWGSNFPVCGDQRVVRRDLGLVQSGVWGLNPRGIEWVTGSTAQRLWFE